MAETTWHYALSGVQHGPVADAELRQLIAAGRLGSGDLVWCEGMPQWEPAHRVPGLLPAAATSVYAPAPMAYASAGAPQFPGVIRKSYNGFAIAGFVMSIIPGVTIVGLIFCLIALSGMKSSGNPEGKGLATAGTVISLVYLGLGCLYMGAIFSCCGISAFH